MLIDRGSVVSFLKEQLGKNLPGFTAQQIMMPEFREHNFNISGLQPASVLFCLVKRQSEYVFPLIRRSEHDKDVHSRQISLPGGKSEPEESLENTALREAEEEIGLIQNKIDIIGQLSPLPIPISGFLVYPFVATYNDLPDYRLQNTEVDEVFEVPIKHLIDKRFQKEMTRSNGRIPYFQFNDKIVWGATAMILSEMAGILLERYK